MLPKTQPLKKKVWNATWEIIGYKKVNKGSIERGNFELNFMAYKAPIINIMFPKGDEETNK